MTTTISYSYGRRQELAGLDLRFDNLQSFSFAAIFHSCFYSIAEWSTHSWAGSHTPAYTHAHANSHSYYTCKHTRTRALCQCCHSAIFVYYDSCVNLFISI